MPAFFIRPRILLENVFFAQAVTATVNLGKKAEIKKQKSLIKAALHVKEIKESIKETLLAILPVSAAVILLQLVLIQLPFKDFLPFLFGLFFVILGLMFFLIGVNIGLLPIGEMIGKILPKSNKAWVIILTGFILGIAVTLAEPDVRVLSTQVDQVSGGKISSISLILSVAAGVGLFVGLAMIRTIYKIPVTIILIAGYAIVFIVSFFSPSSFVPISFDAGGVTTGPLAVPFILALGVGVAQVFRNKQSSGDSFGLVGLASIGPILAVLLLGGIFK